MKRVITFAIVVIICFSALCSCTGKYDKIPPSDSDKRVVAIIDGYEILYDELVFALHNAKQQLEFENILPGKTVSNEEYGNKLNERVYNSLKYNCAVQKQFASLGYTLDDEVIQEEVQQQVVELIDDCGGRKQYIEYLEENRLTDRVLRLNLAVLSAAYKSVYLLSYSGHFAEYGIDFTLDSIKTGKLFSQQDYVKALDLLYNGGIMLRSEHIYIPVSIVNRATVADDVYNDLIVGSSFDSIKNKYDSVAYESFDQLKGERDPQYFEKVSAMNIGDITKYESENGSYIIKRLDLDMNYINSNYYELIYKYLSLLNYEMLENQSKELTVRLTDFGNTLDLAGIK